MRKLICLAMALCLILAAGGCSPATGNTSPASNGSASSQASSDTAENSTTQDKIRIGVNMVNRDQFMSSLEKSILDAAATYSDVEIVAVYDAKYDVQKQMEQIATFATQKVDVIIAGLVDMNIAQEVIDQAQGIPIVFTTRHPDNSVLKEGQVYYVGSPESDAGTLQGEYLANYFKKKGIDEINYVLFMGPLGLENSIERTEYAKKALEDNGIKLNKVFEDTANWDLAEAQSKMQQLLGTGRQIDCVIANNDDMALGAIEALKEVGKLGEIPVVGVDATDIACVSIKAGEMSMSALQNAEAQAVTAVDIAVKIARGEAPSEVLYWIPFEAVTIDNVDQYIK